RLRDNVGNPKALEDRAHWAAGDDSRSGRSRADRHAPGAEMAEAVVVKRAPVAKRHADHRLLGRSGRLANRLRNLARLAVTEACAALAVADDDERGKAEALAALHGLRHAVDVDELLDQLLAALVVAAASATIVATPTAATVTTAAPASTAAATAAARTARLPLPGSAGLDGRNLGLRLLGAFLSHFRRFCLLHHLKLQSAFAGSVGEGLHPAMEQEPAAIEHDRRHSRLLCTIGDRLAHRSGTVLGGVRLALELLVESRGCGERLARGIIDHLGVDVPPGAVDRKPRLARRMRAKRAAHAAAATVEKGEMSHGYFFLPSLRKIYSPRYLMPLPLYGSGLRQRRISAATWPTFCLSTP